MPQTHSLTITHEIFVPREVVFEVWTTPDHLMQWYSPGEGYERRAEVDLRPGGRMYFAWSKPSNTALLNPKRWRAARVEIQGPDGEDEHFYERPPIYLDLFYRNGSTNVRLDDPGLESFNTPAESSVEFTGWGIRLGVGWM